MNDTIRKVAILIDTLDQPSADALLDQMDETTSMRIREAVVDLDNVLPDERDRVLRAFLNGGDLQMDDHGVELSLSTARTYSRQPDSIASTTDRNVAPFRFLHDTTCETLASFLQHEHPQTIAVVISHLPPVRAADVLRRFLPQLQTDVISRVADLDETDPEIIREVERELHSLLSDEIRTSQRRSAGLSAVHAILSAATGEDREEFMTNLAAFDGQLASQIEVAADELQEARPQEDSFESNDVDAPTLTIEHASKPIEREVQPKPTRPSISIAFDDLEQLDDASLARVLGAAKPEMTLLALTGANESFVDRIMQQLPARDAKHLRHKIQQTGPLRLSDVDQAQRHLANLAEQLVEDGEIQVPTARRFAMAA